MKIKKISFILLLLVMFLGVNFVNATEGNVTISDVGINITAPTNGQLKLSFKLSKEIDLSKKKANIKIEYFTEDGDGELIPIKNTLEENNPLIKDKTWAGYLWASGGQYSKGTDNKEQYSDIVPADTDLMTLLRKGVAADGDSMDYFDIDWYDESLKVVIKITATDEFGHGQCVIVKSYTSEVENIAIIDKTPSIYEFTNNAAEKTFTEGKETEFNLGIVTSTVENLGYSSVKLITTVTKPNGGELKINGISNDAFALTKDYSISNIIKVLPSISGIYKIKLDLVDLNNNSVIITTQTITLEVEEKSIIEKIEESMDTKKTEINLSESTVISSEVFEAAKNNNVDVTFNIKNNNKLTYSWTFASDAIDKAANIDLGIKIGSSNKKADIEKITKNGNVLYLSFTHHGELPAPATIKAYVGDKYSDGAKVELYYYNEATNKVELISKNLVVKEGYVTFEIEHCSDYFLSEQINNPVTGDINVLVLASLSLVSLAGIVYISIKK